MSITLVIPVYNEEVNIQKGVIDKIGNFSSGDKRISEVLFVDDGSTDNSREIIRSRYLNKFEKMRLIEKKHQGKAFAVIAGIRKAKNEHVAFSDIDLATPIEEIDKLILEAQHGYPIVIGSRNSTRSGAPILRQIMAKGFIYIRNALLDLKGIRDTQCGFKLFKKKAAIEILDKLHVFQIERQVIGSSVSAGFDLEFLFVAGRLGYKIKEVPVIWRHVETKNVNFLTDSIETLKDIFKIKYLDMKGVYTK